MPDAPLSPSLVHERLMREEKPALAFAGTTKADVTRWQKKLRPILADVTGLSRMPASPPPLRPRVLNTIAHELGRIDKLRFTVEKDCDAVAYLCLPDEAKFPAPWPVFVCLQGHTTGMHNSIGRDSDDRSQSRDTEGDRDFGLQCMARGIVAVCLEMRAFGERREARQSHAGNDTTCYEAAAQALMLGRTLAGERVYDVDRAIDLLEAMDDDRFDLTRLGVMGNSGGGLISILSAALLPRITYAMPSCGFCTYRESVMAMHHCIDNFIPGLMRYAESPDVLGLFAPKPVVVVAGKTDRIFPLPGVKRAFAKLKAIYRAAGAEDRCTLYVGPGGHQFYEHEGWKRMMRHVNAPSR